MNLYEQQAQLIAKIERAQLQLEQLKQKQKIAFGEIVIEAGLSHLEKNELIALLQKISSEAHHGRN